MDALDATPPSILPAGTRSIRELTTVLLGTGNRKKIIEMQSRLLRFGIRVVTPADLGGSIEVEETGSTFQENARLKAIAHALHFEMWAIGEDSGLCVPALGGAPGIYSARFSGPHATDQANNELLLARMSELTGEQRHAFYVSTLTLSDPSGGIVLEAQGQCHGRILTSPRGSGGFGYDPLFEVVEYHQTFAEMGLTVKSAISHRGRSLRMFCQQWERLLQGNVVE